MGPSTPKATTEDFQTLQDAFRDKKHGLVSVGSSFITHSLSAPQEDLKKQESCAGGLVVVEGHDRIAAQSVEEGEGMGGSEGNEGDGGGEPVFGDAVRMGGWRIQHIKTSRTSLRHKDAIVQSTFNARFSRSVLFYVIPLGLDRSGREHIGEGARRGSNLMPDLRAGHRTYSGATSSFAFPPPQLQLVPDARKKIADQHYSLEAEMGRRTPSNLYAAQSTVLCMVRILSIRFFIISPSGIWGTPASRALLERGATTILPHFPRGFVLDPLWPGAAPINSARESLKGL
ncbi:hypothetical protein NMY22_g19957 [Coprinellus aureogranulatus]|nr:hypothetical protein NMY22_g19957 [Coprinellus aureogranulatus]